MTTPTALRKCPECGIVRGHGHKDGCIEATHSDLGPCNPCADKACSICFPELAQLEGLREAADRFELLLGVFSANFQTPVVAEDKLRLAKWRATIAKADA